MALSESVVGRLNRMMEQVTSEVECNSECQEQRKVQSLFEDWKEAEREFSQGSGRVEEKERVYLVAKLGEYEARKFLENKYRITARDDIRAEVKELRSSHQKNAVNLKSLEAAGRIRASLERLFGILEVEQKQLGKATRSTQADVSTNDQRVVYGEKALSFLVSIVYFLMAIYAVAYVAFVYAGPFMKRGEYNTWVGWLPPLFLLFLGIFSNSAANALMICYDKLMWMLSNRGPKDVYVDLR